MMNQEKLKQTLGKVDIYLLDQVMKNRFLKDDKILDAGCGKGRNFSFLYNLGFNIEGCDQNKDYVKNLGQQFPLADIKTAQLENLPYTNESFHHIICNAVLHFANNESHFIKILNELYRILKPNGTLFIRMTSIFGIESLVKQFNGQHKLPDGTNRFLLNKNHILKIQERFNFIEPLKTVNVNDLRCMSTLVLEKK